MQAMKRRRFLHSTKTAAIRDSSYPIELHQGYAGCPNTLTTWIDKNGTGQKG